MNSPTDSSDPGRPVARQVTVDLLKRFDQPGPRYTSYPTAVEFHEGVDASTYEAVLRKANARAADPLSVYMHLPFCESRCLFCGCHVIIMPHRDRASPYLDRLSQEIELLATHLPDRRTISQLHLGGGTPTYYSPEQLGQLLDHLFKFFEPTKDAELAVEVDPRVTTLAHIDTLADRGFNRISLGVQDFTAEVQEAIDRIQSFEETAALIERARGRGYRGINIDLIYGLPYQTPEGFEQTVEKTLEMKPDRVAVYSFAFVPWIRGHMKKLPEDAKPSPETKLTLFALARERFLEAGYEPVGMDHFALPDDELSCARREGRLRRNFQGYSVIPAADVVGLGISAIGDVGGTYVQNAKKLTTYENALDAGHFAVERGVARTADDEVRRDVIHDLMCNFRVDALEIERAHGVDFADAFAPDLELLRIYEKEGMVVISPDHIQVTPLGELFVRNLAMCFDRYQRERHKDGGRPIFSRTV